MLARSHPSIKFIRARAGAVGFVTSSAQRQVSRSKDDDDDDEEDNEEDQDHEVDTDMLPTVLVYRDGHLLHNWVRVDWVIKEELGTLDMDISSLLERCQHSSSTRKGEWTDVIDRHNILPRNSSRARRDSASGDESLDLEFEHDLDY